MKTILLLGAGLSSSSLIRYFLQHAEKFNWQLRVCDQNLSLVKQKLNGHARGVALSFNALNPEERKEEIKQADLVISMLPARFHVDVALDCIKYKTNLITPSYVSNEMKALHNEAQKAGIVIMNEIGVDPGIDHMSASKILDEIRSKNGEIHSFKSFCGGLMAPENDSNPWNYKFTWNPRNVVIAGQGPAAAFIEEKEYKYIPYGKLFERLEKIEVEGYGTFEGYANRNSLSYRPIYKLDTIPTIYRGTLRRPGFAKAWNIFVELGMTEDSYVLENSETLTPRNFINAFLPFQTGESVESKFKRLFTKNDSELYHKFEWLGLFNDAEPIGLKNATPAQLLEKILVDKWKLNDNDKDMLVMHHEFEYTSENSRKKIVSSMVNIGENQVYTAMSNTVGLPVAICGKMILNGKLTTKGVLIPVEKEIYDPILNELENYGITFQEKEITI
ncbi:MAG: saccharopine dehydrogenase NADP-binding domain-containing protein [Crocinitomicaceae bacterium]|nr:saccharopine dehydrogenase NADP-binding domain-containing protein [Crocinitomicaceae bacterium]